MKYQWNHTILIMKEVMNTASLVNEIVNESAEDWLWKVQWKWWEFLMKYSMKVHNSNYERGNEYI